MNDKPEILTSRERYKAQWCRTFLFYPPDYMTDTEILNEVAGTLAEGEFDKHFAIKKAKFELEKVIKEAMPNWVLRLFGL